MHFSLQIMAGGLSFELEIDHSYFKCFSDGMHAFYITLLDESRNISVGQLVVRESALDCPAELNSDRPDVSQLEPKQDKRPRTRQPLLKSIVKKTGD